MDRGFDHARLRDTLQKAFFLRAPGLFLSAAGECRELSALKRPDAPVFAASTALLVYFAAALGDREAARCVAAEAVALAEADSTPEDRQLALRSAALGWLSYSALADAQAVRDPRQHARDAAERSLDDMARAWKGNLGKRQSTLTTFPFGDEADPFPWSGDTDETAENADVREPGHVVVLRSVGGLETSEGARIAKAYQGLSGQSLPLVRTPDLAPVRTRLLEDYPHTAAAVHAVLEELVGRKHVRLRPMILLGPPGIGKTAFCTALLEALGVPGLLYSCGGVADSALGGTSRRWQTGEPCTPLSLMASRQTASPGIVLDELEKAGTSSQNGRIHDVLLGMLEPGSSARWQDPYLQAEVDLSNVVWLATANSTDGIPKPLLDRCRIIRMPAPGPEHLPVLATALLRHAYADRGMDQRWATPLDGMELHAVAAAWQGGSIRRLARLLDGVLSARNRAPVLQ